MMPLIFAHHHALLDTTESAVKNRLAKARGKLKEALAD
jgi:RNA polymerase sigma-70 factor (ECF subfamily)